MDSFVGYLYQIFTFLIPSEKYLSCYLCVNNGHSGVLNYDFELAIKTIYPLKNQFKLYFSLFNIFHYLIILYGFRTYTVSRIFKLTLEDPDCETWES